MPWVLSLIPSQAIILSMAGSDCERLFINLVGNIQMGVTQNKLNDEIWVQISFYRLEDEKQLDEVHHSRGKGPKQEEALGEKPGWRKSMRQSGLLADVLGTS